MFSLFPHSFKVMFKDHLFKKAFPQENNFIWIAYYKHLFLVMSFKGRDVCLLLYPQEEDFHII